MERPRRARGSSLASTAVGVMLLVLLLPQGFALGHWTFTEVVGGDVRTCSVLADDEPNRGSSKLLSVPVSDLFDFTPSWLDSVSARQCQVVEGGLGRLNDALHRSLMGQQAAADKLKAAIFRHTWDRPLAFYFVGESGVGKTSTAHLMARALLSDSKDESIPPKGLLLLDGKYFDSKSSDKIEEYREYISSTIVNQLKSCPHSIVVFDEMDLVDPRTLSVIEPFLDKNYVTYKGDVVSTKQAIFLFISTLDTIDPAASDNDALKQTRDNLVKVWGDRKKILGLVQNVIPFRRLNATAVSDIMRARLEGLVDEYGRREGLKRICFSHALLDALVGDVLHQHPHTNARGVDIVFHPKIAEPLLAQLVELNKIARAKEEERKIAVASLKEMKDALPECDSEECKAGQSLSGIWSKVKKPFRLLSSQLKETSDRTAAYVSDMVQRWSGNEWRSEFEASLYFSSEVSEDSHHARENQNEARTLMIEVRELTTGIVRRLKTPVEFDSFDACTTNTLHLPLSSPPSSDSFRSA